MARTKKIGLMPVGNDIKHDEHTLRIVKRLKAGLTGEVYEGFLLKEGESQIHVAIKAMKTLEFPAARQLFMQESETLAFLMHLEEEANREQGLLLKIAPVFYGRGEYEGNPYLVMEFIEGREILDLLKTSEDGKFSESQALTAAWHLYRMLDVMHRLLRKTYIDLKFENLWWVVSDEQTTVGQLKLTDFGTLEEIKSNDKQKRGVARDLLLAAVYFCKMATGYTPSYSLGELRDFGELKKYLQGASISWGVKRELKRLLHRDQIQRPGDAAIISSSLRTLVDFWTLDAQKVLEVTRKALDRAQTAYDEASEKGETISSKGLDSAYRARAALEILGMRSLELDLAQEQERLQIILKTADHLERGKNLLRGRSYSLAKDVFKEGMTWEDEAATLRRWAYLAELGEDISPSDFESVQERAFDVLENLFSRELWQETLNEFLFIQNVLSSNLLGGKLPKGLVYLQTEAELFNEVALADESRSRDDFISAEAHYRAAQSLLERLPTDYQNNIQENDLGDLKQSTLDMLEKAREFNLKFEVDENFDRAIRSFQVDRLEKSDVILNAYKIVEKAYRDGFALKYHTERLHEVTYAALQNKNYKDAFSLSQIALLAGKIPQLLLDDLSLTASLYHALDVLNIPDGRQFVEELRVALSRAQSDEIIHSCIDDLLARAEEKAAQTQSAELYLALAEIYQAVGGERAIELGKAGEAIKNRESLERHAKIDALVSEVKSLGVLDLEEFSAVTGNHILPYSLPDVLRILGDTTERYRYIQQLLEAAETLSKIDGHLLEQIQATMEKLSAEIASLLKSHAANYEENLYVLNRWWMKIEPLAQWRDRSADIFRDSDASRAIYRQLYGEVTDFLVACYSVLRGKTSVELEEKLQAELLIKDARPNAQENLAAVHVLIENANRVLNMLGPDAWRAIQADSAAAIQKSEAFLSNARQAFEQGQLSRAQALLEQSKPFAAESQEWKSLRAQTLLVSVWEKWQRDHEDILTSFEYDRDILKAIRSYKAQALPNAYWQSSSAASYLKELDRAYAAQIPSLLADYNNPNNILIETLASWLDVSWTNRAALAANPTWDARTWLSDMYPLIAGKDAEGIIKSMHGAVCPLQIGEALANINVNEWRRIVLQKEMERRKEEQDGKIRARNFAIGAAIIAIVCVTMAGIAFLSRKAIVQMVYGTYTPTASPTSTVTPTATATPSATPTYTLTPTAIPVSAYLLADANAVRPMLPVAAEAAWMLMPEKAVAEPPISDTGTWIKESSTDPNTKNETFYSTQKQVRVFWETDQTLYNGYYAIFVLDTKSKSGDMPPLQFQVLADRNPLSPFRGQPIVTFKSTAQNQQSDEWLPLGVYEVPDGQKLGVLADIPPLKGNSVFALSKLLIVKITDPQKALYEALPSGRVLTVLSDNLESIVLDTASKKPLGADYQGASISDPNSWGGSFRSLPIDSLNGISKNVTVQWYFPGLVSPGKYQIQMWIPSANATTQGEVALLLNGKALDKKPLPLVNQKDHSAVWWSVDIWDIPEQGAVAVQFVVDPALNPGGLLGIDAVALVRAE